MKQRMLQGIQDKSRVSQEQKERDIKDLQKQGSSPLQLEYQGLYADQIIGETRAENSAIDVYQKEGTHVDIRPPIAPESPSQEGRAQENAAKQDRAQTYQAHENGAQDNQPQQDEAKQDRAQTYQAHEDGAQGNQPQQDEVKEMRAQTYQAHENEAQGNQPQQDEAKEMRALKEQTRKRRQRTAKSDDNEALRAQQEGRKPLKNSKFQRLNTYRPSTSMSRKKPQTPYRQRRRDM
ncbi:MAG: hypothetical protein Q9217_000183 [Psora testacea]